jgi:hypothetical protein
LSQSYQVEWDGGSGSNLEREGDLRPSSSGDAQYNSVEELVRAGFRKTGTGGNGWTEYYENRAGKEARVEYGPQPHQVQSIMVSGGDAEYVGPGPRRDEIERKIAEAIRRGDWEEERRLREQLGEAGRITNPQRDAKTRFMFKAVDRSGKSHTFSVMAEDNYEAEKLADAYAQRNDWTDTEEVDT